MEEKTIENLKKKVFDLEEKIFDLESQLNRQKIVIKLPDGNFDYEVIKGNGVQNKILNENEEFICTSCDGRYYGEDGFRYYESEILCLDCWEDGDVSE